MATHINLQMPSGTSLHSLVKGFILTKQTEGKSQRTVEYYRDNLKRFLWYAQKEIWPDDPKLITEWHIREFLSYVGSEEKRWGLEGNGSETSRYKATHATIHHYFVVLNTFFNWVTQEGFLKDNPLSKIRISRPKSKVITPYSTDEIQLILRVCDYDYEHNAKYLGSRNKALVLILLDTGIRLSELTNIRLGDIDSVKGYIKILGKGNKERVVRIGKITQKALWRFLIHRGNTNTDFLLLTEEGKPINKTSIQSLIKRLKQRAGVGSKGGVHRFRHTFALNFLRADRNVFNLQYLLGHSDLDMVRRYTSTMGMEDALKAHEKSSPADLLGLK